MSETIQTHDPSTGAALPELAATSPDELHATVAAARAAQPQWWALGFEARAERARSFAARVRDEVELADALARSISTEMGKPYAQAKAEVTSVHKRTEDFIARAREACAQTRASEGGIEVTTQWRPLGVAAVIAPWNYPVSTPNNLVMSALLTGNAVVLKPSEFTPRTGALYHQLLAPCLPEGVLGLVQGGGALGRALVEAELDIVAFTGSIATGQAIMRSAAGGMKRLVLELGGKDPMIVLPGADLAAAAAYAVRSSIANTGQVCVATERVFVPRELEQEFLAHAQRELAGYRVGDPFDPQTDIGPMANGGQRELVLAQIAAARADGAELVVEGAARGPGFWLEPSLLRGVRDDMRIAREETFGPVVAVSSYDAIDEVVRRANDSIYGLGASIWGPPGPETEAVAERIEAGMIGINRGLSAAAGAPWVGWKMSGFGYTRSTEGMRSFMQPRTHARDL